MKTILNICGLVLRFCLHLINTCIFLLSCFFFVICFKSLSLCFLFYLLFATVFVNCPASSFSYFLLHSFQAFLVPTYFFSRLCQGTTGPEGQSTTRPQDQNQRTTGPEDHRTRGPQGQRSLNFFSRGCKYFFQGT